MHMGRFLDRLDQGVQNSCTLDLHSGALGASGLYCLVILDVSQMVVLLWWARDFPKRCV